MSSPENARLLNDGQRRLLGFTLTFVAVVACIALFVLLAIILGRLVGYFSSVIWPLAVAGVLALMLRPVVELLERKLRGRRLLAVILLYCVFILLCAVVLLSLVPMLVEQIIALIDFLPKLWDSVVAFVQRNYPSWKDVTKQVMAIPSLNSLAETVQSQASKLPALVLPSLEALRDGIFFTFGAITHLAIIPIYLFFFLLSRRDPTARLPQHLAFLGDSVREDVIFLVREFLAIIVSFFRGQLLIGLVMGALYALGFTIVGLKFGLFIGLMMGILNVVPYLGTIVGLSITMPLAFFQPDGGMKLVALVLGVKIAVQTIEGWFLTPQIMGNRTGLHPVTIIVAIFFWGTAFNGVLGMILAIPLTAFFVTAWRLAQRKYFAGG